MSLAEMIATCGGGAFGAVILLLSLIQVAPIKVNPWSAIARRIGRAINGEVLIKVEKIGSDLEDLRNICDERDAILCRTHILHFNDEILHGVEHTKEHFDQILIDIKTYLDFCDTHKDFKNDIANMAIENIRNTYKKCMDKNSFL